VTPAVITAKGRAAMAIFAGLSVKRSSNSQTLKMMAAKRVDDDQHRLRYVQRRTCKRTAPAAACR